MNIIAFTGRVTADIELKTTPQGKSVSTFSVAVQRPFTKDKTDFFNVVAWDKLGEFVAKYFRRGEMISVDGYLTQRTYESHDGGKRTVYEVIAQNCGFCGSKNEKPSEDQKPTAPKPTVPKFDDIEDDGNLPF